MRSFRNCKRASSRLVLVGICTLTLTVVQGVAQNSSATNSPNPTAPVVKIQQGPIKYATADSEMAMYSTYCASCHGNAGKGDGPAAASLRSNPEDLTLLAKRNNGVFPKAKVEYILTTSESMPSHDAATMPVWNDAFHALDGGHWRTPVAYLRVHNLISYLEKMQAPARQ